MEKYGSGTTNGKCGATNPTQRAQGFDFLSSDLRYSTALSSIHQQDPTFIYKVEPELKQTIISTQGELHLKIAFEKIKSRFGVEVNLIKPKIPYRETITSDSNSKYRHKKQSGGSGQFAEVWLKLTPGERGEGVTVFKVYWYR